MQNQTPRNKQKKLNKQTAYEVRPEQSVDLLKALHILTPEGKINQDTRRKLKQIYHLFRFIEPLMETTLAQFQSLNLVDHGAGKSYLGFILYDLFIQPRLKAEGKDNIKPMSIFGIETRTELIESSKLLAAKAGFKHMYFLNTSVTESIDNNSIPKDIHIVTALHACDTATDHAIDFSISRGVQHLVLVPCCQAEIASALKSNKGSKNNTLYELWRHPIHTRELGSHLTNVLRCLRLQKHGYQVSVTELVGWEHSMKNELIIASYKPNQTSMDHAKTQLDDLIAQFDLNAFKNRFQ